MTISEAFNLYMTEVRLQNGAVKTIKNYETALHSFLNANADIPVELISHQVIMKWQSYMESRGKQASTVKGELCKLRQVLKYLRKHGVKVMDYRDIEFPSLHRSEAVFLETDEIRAMLEHCTSLRDKALIRALFGCGGRISEVLSLDRDSIELLPTGDGKAEVIGKGSKLITLRFDPNCMKAIDEYLATRSDRLPPIFISGQYRRITVSRVEQIIHVIAGEAAITKNVTPHTFRHSFATDLIRNGAELSEVQQQLNHSNIATTQIYTHHTEDRKAGAYRTRHTVI